MIKKVRKTSRGKNVTLIVERPSNYAPTVTEQIINDDGEVTYILSNGNSQPKELYEKHWGRPKGIILPKGTKGKGLDSRTNFY